MTRRKMVRSSEGAMECSTDNRVVPCSNHGGLINDEVDGSLTTVHGRRDEQGADSVCGSAAFSKEFLSGLPKHQIEAMITALSKERKRRYKRNRGRKYGNLNKGLTDTELRKLLECCRNKKARFAFRLMANLGLRVGEVVKIRMDDLELARKKLYLQTEKARTGDSLYLHEEVMPDIKMWIDRHYDDIQEHDGYLLYSENPAHKRQYVSSNWLRNEFRTACLLAGLNEFYGTSDETYDKRPRKLFRLTTHSLRHTFLTRCYKATHDPVVTQKLGRHLDIKSTMVYIHATQQDVDENMSKVFEKSELEKQKEQAELKKLVELWKVLR